MTRPARVLVAGYGSAGDLFPLVPLALRLRDQGHEVRFAAPRALTLLLRTLALSCIGLGDGREMQVLGDDELVSNRFDGWESWFRVVDRYVAGSLERDVAALEGVVSTWQPDVVVTSSFAAAARTVAYRHGFPHVPVSIYPQMQAMLLDRGFAGRYSRLCAKLAGGEEDGGAVCASGRSKTTSSGSLAELAWGVAPGTLLLHDPVLLSCGALPVGGAGLSNVSDTLEPLAAVGFPYWDDGREDPGDVARAEQWLHETEEPVVVVTMGSFLGASRSGELARLAGEVFSSGARVLVVGPGAAGLEVDGKSSGTVRGTGFVRLSRVAAQAAVVVHHGGIGSMFGTLRAGTPAVVVPRAFDQPFNARLVQGTGIGLAADPMEPGAVGAAIRRVLDDSDFRQRAERLSSQLVTTEQAMAAVEEVVLVSAGHRSGGASEPVPRRNDMAGDGRGYPALRDWRRVRDD